MWSIFRWKVAPRVGAWIETHSNPRSRGFPPVAPRVGAWIETKSNAPTNTVTRESHPVWVRGLKLACLIVMRQNNRRTPCGCVD